jgi:DNA-binding NtrC family response regulator
MTPSTFLVVDDEPGIRKVLSRALARFGHTVVLATTGEEACQVLETNQVDVVMLESWLSLHDLPVLPKPFEIAQLLDLVTRLTESPRREANGT